MNEKAVTAEAVRTALYRLFAADGELLYIGITKNLARRFERHAAEKDWWPEVSRKAIEWYETRDAAEIAEEAAIKIKKPRYNIVHSTTPPLRITVELPGYWATGLEMLHRTMFSEDAARHTYAVTLAALLERELSARGLHGDPHCWHTWTGWPDGLVLRELECPCGKPIAPDGTYVVAITEDAA